MTKIAQISDIHWRGSARHSEYFNAFTDFCEMMKTDDKPDVIVCTGDIFHTKTQGITPEVIEKMVWMFDSLQKVAPVRILLGNHDGNLANSNRQDSISPIIKAFNAEPRMILYKQSGNYDDVLFPEINWSVFSCFDKEGWKNVKMVDDKINIALYHGSIIGCRTDGGFQMMGGEESVSFFHGYDFVLMGDIHKAQFLSERQDKNGIDKPWMGYPGSMIQQNFGEEEKKGYLIWDIKDKTDWDVSFKELPNKQPFITTPWEGTGESTLEKLLSSRASLFPGSRIRISSQQNITDIERRQLQDKLKKTYAIEEVTFQLDVSNNLESIQTDTLKIQKTSLRNNPDVLVQLYNEYVINNQQSQPLTEEQTKEAADIINKYLAKLNGSEGEDITARDVTWSLKSLDFDNIFRYGEGNSIDFSKLNGIVGVFGPNRAGKSSIIGTMMYALFNATDRGPIKTAHVINKNSSSCRVRAHIDIGGKDYVLERTSQKDELKRKRKKEFDDEKTSTSLTLTMVGADGEAMSKNGISRDDTDRELRKLIGTADDFLLTSFASQGDMNRFISEGATERKAILSRFLDLDVFKKLCDYAKEDCSGLNAKTKRYSETQWELIVEDIRKNIKNLEASKVVFESRQMEKRLKYDDLKMWILQKEKEFDMALIHKLEVDLLSKERQVENANRLFSELSLLAKTKQSELLQVDLMLGNNNADDLEKKQETLQGIKEKLMTLESTFKIESTNLQHQEKAIKKLDVVPCGTSFPSCHYIKDAHEAKSVIEEQKQLVSSLEKEYSSLKDEFSKLLEEKIADKIKENKLLVATKQKLEASILEIKNKQKQIDVVKLVSERENLKESLEKIRLSLDEAEEQEIEQRKQDLENLGKEIEEVENQKNETLLSLGSNKQKLEQCIREQNECSVVLGQLQVFESVYKAFNKNGIPAMILKNQLPAINLELEKILSGIFDFKVELETDTSSNVMDVFLSDKDGKRIIETASGMEKTIASMALRVALTNLSSLPKSDIFIMDEGFGPLDETSVYQCLQLMNLLKTYFRVILVITHITPVKEIADKLIEIKNEGQTSFVMV